MPNKVKQPEFKRLTPDVMRRLREDAKEIARHGTSIKAAKALANQYPEISVDRLSEFLTIFGRACDYVYGLALDGKISFGMLETIARGGLDPATQETMTRLLMERMVRNSYGQVVNAGVSQIQKIKRILLGGIRGRKGKGQVSLADAIAIACGDRPAHARPEDVRKSLGEFGGIVGSVIDASIAFMAKLQLALDLLPGSSIGTGANWAELFEKIVTFENTLENAHRFVAARKKTIMEALRSHVGAEAMMDQLRKGGANEIQG